MRSTPRRQKPRRKPPSVARAGRRQSNAPPAKSRATKRSVAAAGRRRAPAPKRKASRAAPAPAATVEVPEAAAASPAPRVCGWCREPLTTARGRFCSRKHRQAAFRVRKRRTIEVRHGRSMRVAYADPPYPGQARKRYGRKEVNHPRLIKRLASYDGWALSTSARALRKLLPLCPPDVRVASWTKLQHGSPRTRGIHNVWEAVIVRPARNLQPGTPDALVAASARGGGEDLIGRKPIAFAAWLFGLLGMVAGDQFEDLFPGTGAVTRAWLELTRPPAPPPKRRRRPSARKARPRPDDRPPSPEYSGDTSTAGRLEAAPEGAGEGGQNHPPPDPPEPRADPAPVGSVQTPDEIN